MNESQSVGGGVGGGGPLGDSKGSGASLFPEERMPVTQTRGETPLLAPFRNHPVI